MYRARSKYREMRCLRKLRNHASFFFLSPVNWCGIPMGLSRGDGKPKRTPESQITRARNPKNEVLRSSVLSTIICRPCSEVSRVNLMNRPPEKSIIGPNINQTKLLITLQ